MENSILKSTKKILGIDPDYTAFDADIITHINSTFFTLSQLGIGPRDGFMIIDDTALWSDYITNNSNVNAIKTYVYLKVRLVFDPPTPQYVLDAFEKQVQELEWRLNVHREDREWVDPNPVVGVPNE